MDALGLLLQVTLLTLLLLVCIAYVVAVVRYAGTEPRSGRTRAVSSFVNWLRRHCRVWEIGMHIT